MSQSLILCCLIYNLCCLFYIFSMWSPLNIIYTQVTLKIPLPLCLSYLPTELNTNFLLNILPESLKSISNFTQLKQNSSFHLSSSTLDSTLPQLRKWHHHPLLLLKPKLRDHLSFICHLQIISKSCQLYISQVYSKSNLTTNPSHHCSPNYCSDLLTGFSIAMLSPSPPQFLPPQKRQKRPVNTKEKKCLLCFPST